MQRRNFLHAAAAAGLSLVLAPPRRARAANAKYEGPFWITVHAGGGWDPTVFCDPKGGTANDRDSVNQTFTKEQIVKVGPFACAPVALTTPGANDSTIEVMSPRMFFERNGSRVVVMNGVDTSTNNHETGTRLIWSGRSGEGYPNIGALAAASVFKETPAPMAFLSYGGYDVTGGAVPLTRAGNVDNLWRVAFPNRIDPRNAESAMYHSDATWERLAKAQQARLGRLAQQEPMPVERRALATLLSSRSGDAGLSGIAEYLPTRLVGYDDVPELAAIPGNQRFRLGGLEGLMRQVQLALASFRAGVAVSASLSFGGYDTHNDHDNQHVPQMMRLMRGVDYLYEQLRTLGLEDKVYVVVGSDFGRTPFYNGQNGKDHWAVTSMLVSGPGIAGGRVVGASTDDFKPKTIDRTSLAESSTGIRLKPEHVHAALRKHAKLDTTEVGRNFPLAVEQLPLLQA